MRKKKILFLALSLILVFSLSACGKSDSKNGDNTQATSKQQDQTKKNEESKKDSNTQAVDGLTLTVNSKIEAVKGDRTKDNVADENGEYIADGSDIVKAADYKKVVVSVDIKNDTDKAVQMNSFNWGAELQDGYKLKQTITGDTKDAQVQSKSTGKYDFYYVVKNDVKAEKIKLTYLWVKNDTEFKKIISDPNNSKLSEKEAKEKFKDVYTSVELETDIKK